MLVGVVSGSITYGLALLAFPWAQPYSASLRDLILKVRSVFAHFNFAAVLVISACAAIGEEVLFRLFAQNLIGSAFAYTDSIGLAISWHVFFDCLSLLVFTRYPGVLLLSADPNVDAFETSGNS